jgi:hypothetical protein
MAFYNLLGQTGPKGQTNPDAPEAGPYIYFNEPPGRGDNKGLVKTSFGSIGVADEKAHNKKLEEAGLDPIPSDKDLSSTSFAPREEVEAKEVLAPATNSEINNVNNIVDLAQLAFKKNISTTQKNKLIGLFGFDREAVESIIIAGDTADEIDYITQLNEEDAFIRNIVSNNMAIAKAEEEKRDTRSLVEKETDYIKQYVENKTKGIDPGDVNYIEQLNEEMEYITNFVNNNVKPKVNQKLDEGKDENEVVEEISNETAVTTVTTTPTTTTTPTVVTPGTGQITNTAFTQFNNIPENGLLWDVGGSFYIVYEVPGSQGELYEGNPMYMAYELKDNDVYAAGLLTQGETAPQPNATMDQAFFNSIAIVTGNTDQLTALIDNPFASFVETVGEQAQVAPWITDPEMIALIAEAAVEGREISDAEWQTTNWYQTHNESEREWLRTYYEDPSTATQLTTDSQIAVANSLQAAGVSNAPEALINWVAGKFVSGEWSQTYTTEQISLFADPYATGKRDASFENYLSSTAISGVDRTTEREREVTELYNKWLGPTLGKLTESERAEIAGRLRDDPDYQDQLVQSLKQSRLAAFSNYTNPELTYEDIARPWRNLTTSVWGQTADETQGWWQEMVKTNDFAKAQNTLREKGLEQDITQVTTDATQALQQALGQGTVSQSGVNV